MNFTVNQTTDTIRLNVHRLQIFPDYVTLTDSSTASDLLNGSTVDYSFHFNIRKFKAKFSSCPIVQRLWKCDHDDQIPADLANWNRLHSRIQLRWLYHQQSSKWSRCKLELLWIQWQKRASVYFLTKNALFEIEFGPDIDFTESIDNFVVL